MFQIEAVVLLGGTKRTHQYEFRLSCKGRWQMTHLNSWRMSHSVVRFRFRWNKCIM